MSSSFLLLEEHMGLLAALQQLEADATGITDQHSLYRQRLLASMACIGGPRERVLPTVNLQQQQQHEPQQNHHAPASGHPSLTYRLPRAGSLHLSPAVALAAVQGQWWQQLRVPVETQPADLPAAMRSLGDLLLGAVALHAGARGGVTVSLPTAVAKPPRPVEVALRLVDRYATRLGLAYGGLTDVVAAALSVHDGNIGFDWFAATVAIIMQSPDAACSFLTQVVPKKEED